MLALLICICPQNPNTFSLISDWNPRIREDARIMMLTVIATDSRPRFRIHLVNPDLWENAVRLDMKFSNRNSSLKSPNNKEAGVWLILIFTAKLARYGLFRRTEMEGDDPG